MNPWSRIALLSCFILIFLGGFVYYPKWKQTRTEATISWDASGYYMYLPALFIYKDIKKCSFKDKVIELYYPTPDFQQAFQLPNGNYVMKYSSGQALMFCPFFLAAHMVALGSDEYAADGFSRPYQLSISIGMLLYCFLGLYVLRKVLLRFFSDRVTALTLITLVLGSNYFNYASIDGAMTHNTLFTIYAMILWNTIRFYENPTWWRACVIGLLNGLATLTRPTEMISLLLPLLWNIGSFQDFKSRLLFLGRNYKYPLILVFSFLLIGSVQLGYWKWVSGHWLVYSYQNETFDWLHPHIWKCLVSYRSGWLTYSPVMILALAGFITLFKKHRKIFWPAALFSLVFMYLCFSWQTWWYGGSLGQRAMVQAYPVLALPLASLLNYLMQKNFLVRILTLAFIALCTWLNLWFTHQGHKGGLLIPGEMNRNYFWAVIGRSEVNKDVFSLLDNKDLYRGDTTHPHEVYSNDFENDTSSKPGFETVMDSRRLVLDAAHPVSSEYFFIIGPEKLQWLRASADFEATQKEWNTWKMPQFILKFYRSKKVVSTHFIRVFRLLEEGEQKKLHVDARIPSSFDEVSVTFWNGGSDKKIYIDNLRVVAF